MSGTLKHFQKSIRLVAVPPTDLIDNADNFDKISLNSTRSRIYPFKDYANILQESSLPPSDRQGEEEEDCFEASPYLICSVLFQIAKHGCGGTSYMDSSWTLNVDPVRVLLLALSVLIKRRDKSVSPCAVTFTVSSRPLSSMDCRLSQYLEKPTFIYSGVLL